MTQRATTFTYASAAAIAAGLVIGTSRRRTGAALMLAGLAGAGTVMALRRPGQLPASYQPVDTLKPLAGQVWIVDSGPLHGVLPLRMTVIALPDGGLLLHSPTQMTPQLRAQLDQLGPVRALVAPNVVHWMFLRAWQLAYPDAKTWAAPGLRERAQVRQAGVVIDHDLSGTPPRAWGDVITLTTVPGGFGFSEIAFFHRPSRTLVLTDLVLNLEAGRLPPVMRPVARLLGVVAPSGRAPIYVRAVFRLGGWAARHAAAALVQLRPDRVVFAHGRIFEQGAAASLAQSLAWLLPKGKDAQ